MNTEGLCLFAKDVENGVLVGVVVMIVEPLRLVNTVVLIVGACLTMRIVLNVGHPIKKNVMIGKKSGKRFNALGGLMECPRTKREIGVTMTDCSQE